MKNIRYFFESVLLYALFGFFKCLPASTASNIGGYIGSTIGPKLGASRKARRHLLLAMPDTSKERQDKIIKGMWDNLGRIIAEYPHLESISTDSTKFVNEGRLTSLLEAKTPLVFFGGHIGNWEINSIALLTQHDKAADITFRPPNNPWAAKLLDKARTLNHRITAYPKSRESGRKILQSLKNGHALGILIDQKYNEGIKLPFFGVPAMTNPIFVQLCQRYKCPLVPIRNVRTKGCNFTVNIYPPLNLFDKDGKDRPVEDVIKDAHMLLETWIKEKPEQWIWLHRRWIK